MLALFGAVAVQTLQYGNQLKQNDMADHAFTFGCQLFMKRSLYTLCSFGVIVDDQSHQNVCHAWQIQRGLLQNLVRRISFLQCCKSVKLCVNGSRKVSGDTWPARGALVIVMRPSGCGAKSTLSPGCGPNNSRIPLCSVICVLLVNVEIIWAHREMGGGLSDPKESDQVATGYCLPVDIVDDRLANNAITAVTKTNAIIGPPPNPKSK